MKAYYSVKEGKNPAKYTLRKPAKKPERKIKKLKGIPCWE
jgi:hypothetical protein